MEPVNQNNRTCLNFAHGKMDLSNGAVRCKQHDKEVVAWFVTPKQCLDYKDQA